MRYSELLEFVSRTDLEAVEQQADELFSRYNIDIEFTRHFHQRMNDARNGDPIKTSELLNLLKKVYDKYGKMIAQQRPDFQAVMKDISTDLNLPFVLDLDTRNHELDLVGKTIMRKKNFHTPNPELKVESKDYKRKRKLEILEQYYAVKRTGKQEERCKKRWKQILEYQEITSTNLLDESFLDRNFQKNIEILNNNIDKTNPKYYIHIRSDWLETNPAILIYGESIKPGSPTKDIIRVDEEAWLVFPDKKSAEGFVVALKLSVDDHILKDYEFDIRLSETAGVGTIVSGVNTTADVGPDEIRKQARKFGNKVTKDGRPPIITGREGSKK